MVKSIKKVSFAAWYQLTYGILEVGCDNHLENPGRLGDGAVEVLQQHELVEGVVPRTQVCKVLNHPGNIAARKVFNCRILIIQMQVQYTCKVQGARCKVQGARCKVQGVRCKV